MRLSDWLGFAKREDTTDDTPFGITIPSRSEVVTEDGALSLINVYRAVQILGVAAAQLTLDVYRGREVLETPSVVRKPDLNMNASRWLSQIVHALALTGNAYWRTVHGDRGPINFTLLDPWKCRPNKNGTLAYGTTTLEAHEFQHLALMSRTGHSRGLGPIQAARAELRGAFDLREYASNTFRDGDVPTGILTTDQPLSEEQAKRTKDTWKARDAREIAVIGSGVHYSPVMLSPEDAQFIESQRFTKTEIATLFGIPAHLLLASVEGSSMTYTNIASADLTFVRWTLMGYLREIEEAVTASLPGQQTARFNIDGITRPDISTRYKAHKTALDGGWMTKDEIRAIEGLPPLEGNKP